MATKIGCFVIFLYSSLSQRTIAKPTCLTGLPHLFQTFSHMAKYWKVKVKYIQIAKPNRKDGKKKHSPRAPFTHPWHSSKRLLNGSQICTLSPIQLPWADVFLKIS